MAERKPMRAMPVSYLGRPATLREAGRLVHPVTMYRVKRPEESHGPWDYDTAVGTLPVRGVPSSKPCLHVT